jgi:type VI secretion system protein VasD
LGIQRMWCDRTATLALIAVLLAADGCKSKAPKPAPPPVPARLAVIARTDVNPDEAGRASPVVLRVYQLKDDAAFRNADFFALFDKEQATLAASLIERQEFVLAPGDQKSLEYPISGEAKFLAVAAAYRDIRNADWRALTPAPRKTYKNLVKSDQVSVGVEKSRVTLAVSD